MSVALVENYLLRPNVETNISHLVCETVYERSFDKTNKFAASVARLWLLGLCSICQIFVSHSCDFFSVNESHKRKIASFNYSYNFYFSSERSRQVQNLRDELYQSKLRLEKETSSLKEANKVRFEFSKFLSDAMYEENKLNTRIAATIQELYFGFTINKTTENYSKLRLATKVVDALPSTTFLTFCQNCLVYSRCSRIGIFNNRLI